MTNLVEKIKEQDEIAESISSGLHFNHDDKYKTTLGGIISIIIQAFLVYYTANNAYSMIIHANPYILSLSRAIDFKKEALGSEIYPLDNMTKIHFEIVDRDWKRYNFEASRPYLTMDYVHIKTYFDEDGVLQKTKKAYPLVQCTPSLFDPVEIAVIDVQYDINQMICPDYKNPDLVFQGSKESTRFKQTEQYSIIEIKRCETTETWDKCAKEKDMNKWLESKILNIRYNDKTVNFQDESKYVGYTTQYGYSMKLLGDFTDIGYRFRQNIYNTQDFWYIPFTDTSTFFNLVTYNYNPVNVPDAEVTDAKKIAEVWFRIDTNIMEHNKQVTSFFEFLSSLAGMSGFLFGIAASIFGSYICFQQQNSRCLDLYQGDEGEDDDFNNKFTKSQFGLYMTHFSSFAWMCFCCKSKHDRAREVIENWEAKFKRDIDYKPVMEMIMRQEGEHLRVPGKNDSISTIFPMKNGANDSVELNGKLNAKVNGDSSTQNNHVRPVQIDFNAQETPLE